MSFQVIPTDYWGNPTVYTFIPQKPVIDPARQKALELAIAAGYKVDDLDTIGLEIIYNFLTNQNQKEKEE